MIVLGRLLTRFDTVCDMMEVYMVVSDVLVFDDDDKEEDGFDKEELDTEAAMSGGPPAVVFEGMGMFNTGAD